MLEFSSTKIRIKFVNGTVLALLVMNCVMSKGKKTPKHQVMLN